MSNRRNLMLRALENELKAEERAELHHLLETDPAAAQEFRRLQTLARTVKDSAASSFGPSFALRVVERMGRVTELRSYSLTDFLSSMFYRVAGAALALSIMIGVYNMTTSSGIDQTPIEAALGLPSISVESAYESALGSLALNTIQGEEESRGDIK